MEPFIAKKLPFEYRIDKELLNLISEANQKYGEYKSHLSNLEFDYRFFLDSILLNESLKSTQIEGTQISQDEIENVKSINGASIHVIMPILIKQIVFTKSEIEKLTNLSRSTINRLIDGLVQLGILIQDSSRIKKGYKYLRVYDVFVGKEYC